VKVRLAEAADFDSVTALLEELGRRRVTDETREACKAMFERHLADDQAAHLVAEDDGAVVGFCSLHFRERLNFTTPDAWVPRPDRH
jgi:L-amino acid N-acyltransferase YncA